MASSRFATASASLSLQAGPIAGGHRCARVDREHAELGLDQSRGPLAWRLRARIVAAAIVARSCGGRRDGGGLGQRMDHGGLVIELERGPVSGARNDPQHRLDHRDADSLDHTASGTTA